MDIETMEAEEAMEEEAVRTPAQDGRHAEMLRQCLMQPQGFVPKPTAYEPHGRHGRNPLRAQLEQLSAKMQALRSVRRRLRFVGAGDGGKRTGSVLSEEKDDNDEDMKKKKKSAWGLPAVRRQEDSPINVHQSITTSVALLAQPPRTWVCSEGGIAALSGLEALVLPFLTTSELVTVSGVCQSWYTLARDDLFWEPRLVTPLEGYPLRALLGLEREHEHEREREGGQARRLPAIHVYSVFCKLRLPLMHMAEGTDADEFPRVGTDDAHGWMHPLIRRRQGGAHAAEDAEEDEGGGAEADQDEEIPAWWRRHRARIRPATMLAATSRGSSVCDGNWGAMRQQSMHLVSMKDGGFELVFNSSTSTTAVSATLVQQDVEGGSGSGSDGGSGSGSATVRPAEERMALSTIPQDEDMNEANGLLLDLLGAGLNEPQGPLVSAVPERQQRPPVMDMAPPEVTKQASRAMRRIRLSTWFTMHHQMTEPLFRSFLYQMLLAISALERGGYVHSGVSVNNILVLETIGPCSVSSSATDSTDYGNGKKAEPPLTPLFQLFCSRGVNTWLAVERSLTAMNAARHHQGGMAPAIAFVMDNGINQFDLPPAGNLVRRHGHPPPAVAAHLNRMGDVDSDSDDDEDGNRLPLGAIGRPIHHLPMRQRRHGRHHHRRRDIDNAGTTISSPHTMIVALLRLACDVWGQGRLPEVDRTIAPMALLHRRGQHFPPGLRSFIEYGIFLLRRELPITGKLLQHAYMHDDRHPSTNAVPFSPLIPGEYPDVSAYTRRSQAWYSLHCFDRPPHQHHRRHSLGRHRRCARQRHGHRVDGGTEDPTLTFMPRTLLGVAFLRDALHESRLATQRFVSVVAPASATSSWVHTLATTQSLTLQLLDLSRVSLPTSILLTELRHLPRLVRVRLPRELLRDENMEQFISALCCAELLPRLRVMDVAVKQALDRLEHVYATQRDMVHFLLSKHEDSQLQEQEQPRQLQQHWRASGKDRGTESVSPLPRAPGSTLTSAVAHTDVIPVHAFSTAV